LLDLENDIEPGDRILELWESIKNQIVTEFQSANTEDDILRILKGRPHLYTVPPFVLEYFNLERR